MSVNQWAVANPFPTSKFPMSGNADGKFNLISARSVEARNTNANQHSLFHAAASSGTAGGMNVTVAGVLEATFATDGATSLNIESFNTVKPIRIITTKTRPVITSAMPIIDNVDEKSGATPITTNNTEVVWSCAIGDIKAGASAAFVWNCLPVSSQAYYTCLICDTVITNAGAGVMVRSCAFNGTSQVTVTLLNPTAVDCGAGSEVTLYIRPVNRTLTVV